MAGNVVVIGAGLNGLAAALVLAKAGRNVIVCERRGVMGGLAAGESFAEGYTHTGLLHETHRLHPDVLAAMGDMKPAFRDAPDLYAPEPEGPGLVLPGDLSRAAEALDARSSGDGPGWAALWGMVGKARSLALSVLESPAPRLGPKPDLVPLARHALQFRRMGDRDMMEFLRVGALCADDWLGEHLQDPLSRAALQAPGFHGAWMSPRSPTSATTVLLDWIQRDREIVGGPASLVDALAGACRSSGVEIRIDAPVAQIQIEGGAAVGVTLADGEPVPASAVLSTIAPTTTLLDLVDPGLLDPLLEDEISKLRTRGTLAKVHLGLSGPLALAGREGELFERLHVGPHPLDIERAFDAVRLRRLPEAPWLDVRVPSAAEHGLAPEGHHVASVAVWCAPHDLDGGWTDEARDELADRVIAQLARFAPGAADLVVAREVLAPPDIAARYGAPDGHPFHGELGLDQLWIMRPGPNLSRHTTPFTGLYLGSSGTHGGGRLTCGAGALAAKAVLGS